MNPTPPLAARKRVVLAWNYSVIEPLFALYLGGVVRDAGHAWTGLPIRKYDYEPLFQRVEDFGATDVGFNVYSGNHRQVFAVADRLRHRGVRVHIGGPHATYFAVACAAHADWVYRGQSFDSFAAVLADDPAHFVRESLLQSEITSRLETALRRRTRGAGIPAAGRLPPNDVAAAHAAAAEHIDSRQGREQIQQILRSRILFRAHLSDAFPKSDRETFYRDNPEYADNPIKNTICGEGCPFTCSYCYNVAWNSPEMYGRFRRRVLRKIDDLIEELLEIRKYPTRLIYFQDDVFGFEMPWLREFMPRYRDEVGLPFHAQLRLELAAGAIGQERLAWMKLGGCSGVTVAVESGSPAVRKDVLDRPMRDAHVFDGCRNIRTAGMKLRTEQMLGVPTRTTHPGGSALPIDLLTLELNVLVRPEIAWSAVLAPYGGTELGRLCAELGLYPAEKLATNDDLRDSFFDDTALDYGDLYKDQVRVLQRLFSTLARIDQGHRIAERFLTEALPRFSHREIEEFLVPAKDIAKRTKTLLYDGELYGTADRRAGVAGTNDKSHDELLDGSSPLPSLDDEVPSCSTPQAHAAIEYLLPLWRLLPCGPELARHFATRFPGYSRAEQESFLAIVRELSRIAQEVLAQGEIHGDPEVRNPLNEDHAFPEGAEGAESATVVPATGT